MSEELVLSELANELGVSHSSADTPADIKRKLKAKFDASQPLALSETAMGMARENRSLKIDALSLGESPRITPAIAKALKAKFCSDDLVLSEGQTDGFEAVMEVLNLLDGRSLKSKTKGQTLKLSEEDGGNRKESKLVAEMKKRRGVA